VPGSSDDLYRLAGISGIVPVTALRKPAGRPGRVGRKAEPCPVGLRSARQTQIAEYGAVDLPPPGRPGRFL